MTDRNKKLVDLGAETLADALLELAVHSEQADDLIKRLIATPKENSCRNIGDVLFRPMAENEASGQNMRQRNERKILSAANTAA